MKKEEGLSFIGVIIIICIIVFLVVFGVTKIKEAVHKEEIEHIKANMLLIQGATKVAKQNSVVKKSNDVLVGTKLSEIEDNEIINDFKGLNIIEEGQYEKYYMLTNEDLAGLNIEVSNENMAYYLVNYDENEVIITKEVGGKYKLSEMEEDDENEVNEKQAEGENEVKEEQNGDKNDVKEE